MDLPKNLFKARLLRGESQIGLWCTLADATAAEIVAGSGFDWLLLDTEHAPGGVETTLSQLQAVAAYPVSAVVRPAANDPVLIKKFLDIGAQTLLVPFVCSAAEAAAAVAATRYPPDGVRGVAGTTRATRYGRVKAYHARAAEELCVLVQIETSDALAQLEAIAATPGVDGVFIGPNDLAASMGHAGDAGNPAVIAAVEDAIRRLKAIGKPSGVYIGPALAKRCIELGSTFTAVGGDMGLLARGTEALAASFRT
jgi:4-hydroxy-2-oxoheptanedioate aldolase